MADDVVYGARAASLGTSDLYTIDVATGEVTSVGPIGFAVTGLAWDPVAEILYGATSNNSTLNKRTLITIDPDTGAGTVIGVFGTGLSMGDIACDSAGNLYGWSSSAPVYRCLYSINKATGAATRIGSTDYGMNSGCALAFDADDVLWQMGEGDVASGGHLFTIDPATSAPTTVAALTGYSGGGAMSAAAFGSDGTLLANDNTNLVTVTVPGGVVALVGATIAGLDALVVIPGAPAPPSGVRFFQGHEWRFLVTDLNTVSVSWANGLLTNRQVALNLDEPSVINADVMPNSRQVNEMFGGDDDPRLAQQNRLLYAFRREGGSPPWVCRAAGIIQAIQDQGDTDAAVSHIAAYDPWRYLDARPCMQSDGSLPTSEIPLNFLSDSGDEIIVALLQATLDNAGAMFIDFGQTAFYGGTIEATEVISYECQPGTMVGSTLTDLCDAGHLDIILRAVYDPVNRPGITHELSVYNLAGVERPRVVFGWDRMNRALSEIDRMRDGSPGAWVNVVQFFTADGAPVPQQVNGLSVAKYGQYWAQQFFPGQDATTGEAVLAMAKQAIVLAKQGLRTTNVRPTPQRSKVPLVDYELGDRVKVYASRNLRVISEGYQRVQGIPIAIDDDGIEVVTGLLLSPDWVEAGS